MKRFKSISAKLGMTLAILALLAIQPIETHAQHYYYKIVRSSTITIRPDGSILIHDYCTHGPGLCGHVIPPQQ